MTDEVKKEDIEKEVDLEAEQAAQAAEEKEEEEKLNKTLEEISSDSEVPGVDPPEVDDEAVE